MGFKYGRNFKHMLSTLLKQGLSASSSPFIPKHATANRGLKTPLKTHTDARLTPLPGKKYKTNQVIAIDI